MKSGLEEGEVNKKDTWRYMKIAKYNVVTFWE
jgi:hypothetical protein